MLLLLQATAAFVYEAASKSAMRRCLAMRRAAARRTLKNAKKMKVLV
jgi:hypothetical protein